MEEFDYNNLYERILKSKDYNGKQKKALLKILDFVYSYSDEELKKHEDMTYTVNGKTLDDNNRIKIELIKIKKNLKEVQSKNNYNEYSKINDDKFLKIMKEYESNTDYNMLKKDITEYQINNGLNPKFYTSFNKILNMKILTEVDKKNEDDDIIL